MLMALVKVLRTTFIFMMQSIPCGKTMVRFKVLRVQKATKVIPVLKDLKVKEVI